MAERDLVKRFGAFGYAPLLLVVACTGTPKNEIAAPDPDLVSVFYPVDGLVLGLGLAGAVPPNVDHVAVQAHPTATGNCVPVRADGSFEFSVVAIDDDVLEINGAVGAGCKVRGAPAFVRVPKSPLPPVDFVCCHPAGTCQSKTMADDGMACPDAQTGVKTCTFDEECGAVEGEILDLVPSQIAVTSPDPRGRVVVEGRVDYPNALVRLRNLGLSPLGVPTRVTRYATITDEAGNFAFASVAAAGDDELAVQVQDLNGFRSPPIGKTVPDAELAGIDIIGVYAYEDLGGTEVGPIALHLAPYGIDQRGICPNTGAPEDWICYTGGITHDMVQITSAEVVGNTEPLNLRPARTSSNSVTRRYNRGVVGDVRSPAQDIVIVLDLSAAATPSATDRQIQIGEVKRFIGQVRARDRIGIVVTTDWDQSIRLLASSPDDPALKSFEDRGALAATLDQYIVDPDPTSVSGPLDGLTEAGSMLRRAGSTNGKIVLLLATAPGAEYESAMDSQERQAAYDVRKNIAFDAVLGASAGVDVSYQTHILGMNLARQDDFSFLEDITDFSRGRYWATTDVASELRQTLTDVQQELSGAFILLYDMDVPCVGKSMTLELSIDLVIDQSSRASSTYRGPVRIARGCVE